MTTAMNIDSLLSKEAFKSLDEETQKTLRYAMEQLKGKNGPESVPIIMACMASMPKDLKLTNQQREAMINEVLEALPNEEQEQMKWIIKMMKLK